MFLSGYGYATNRHICSVKRGSQDLKFALSNTDYEFYIIPTNDITVNSVAVTEYQNYGFNLSIVNASSLSNYTEVGNDWYQYTIIRGGLIPTSIERI